MPILELHAPLEHPPAGLLPALAGAVSTVLSIPPELVWVFWKHVPEGSFHQPRWSPGRPPAPVVFMRCRATYSREQVGAAMEAISQRLGEGLSCDPKEVFVAVQRIHPFELLTRGEIWKGAEDMDAVTLKPVGVVHGSRKTPEDDHWGGEVSTIELDATRFTEEAIAGLTDFSHLEVVFLMHLVPDSKIETGARHPRNRQDWPLAGIFAQRAKGRPNRLGVSRCRLLKVEGLKLTVEGLDAIEGTPVLDIKPYMVEFGPRGEVVQPAWATEVMKEYY